MTEQTTLTRRDLAHLAREFGAEQGLPGFGSRGRVSEALVLAFVQAQPAKTVREYAEALSVEVSPKGKISEAEYAQIAATVAKNAPKPAPEAE